MYTWACHFTVTVFLSVYLSLWYSHRVVWFYVIRFKFQSKDSKSLILTEQGEHAERRRISFKVQKVFQRQKQNRGSPPQEIHSSLQNWAYSAMLLVRNVTGRWAQHTVWPNTITMSIFIHDKLDTVRSAAIKSCSFAMDYRNYCGIVSWIL